MVNSEAMFTHKKAVQIALNGFVETLYQDSSNLPVYS